MHSHFLKKFLKKHYTVSKEMKQWKCSNIVPHLFLTPPIEVYLGTNVRKNFVTTRFWQIFILSHPQLMIAQLIAWSFLMILSVSFTSATFEAFAEAYLSFLVLALVKKNAEVIKCLWDEVYICSRKKSNVSFNKSYICLSHSFQTWFHNADNLLYYPQMSVSVLQINIIPLPVKMNRKMKSSLTAFSM